MNHLYRSKPVKTTYCVAIKHKADGADAYTVQETDSNGKPLKEAVLTIAAHDFESKFEPIQRKSKKQKEQPSG